MLMETKPAKQAAKTKQTTVDAKLSSSSRALPPAKASNLNNNPSSKLAGLTRLKQSRAAARRDQDCGLASERSAVSAAASLASAKSNDLKPAREVIAASAVAPDGVTAAGTAAVAAAAAASQPSFRPLPSSKRPGTTSSRRCLGFSAPAATASQGERAPAAKAHQFESNNSTPLCGSATHDGEGVVVHAEEITRASVDLLSSLTDARFEAFTRDVAARIIQTYWRRRHVRKQNQAVATSGSKRVAIATGRAQSEQQVLQPPATSKSCEASRQTGLVQWAPAATSGRGDTTEAVMDGSASAISHAATGFAERKNEDAYAAAPTASSWSLSPVPTAQAAAQRVGDQQHIQQPQLMQQQQQQQQQQPPACALTVTQQPARTIAVAPPPPATAHSLVQQSLTAEKLTDIMSFLDDVDQQAEQEALHSGLLALPADRHMSRQPSRASPSRHVSRASLVSRSSHVAPAGAAATLAETQTAASATERPDRCYSPAQRGQQQQQQQQQEQQQRRAMPPAPASVYDDGGYDDNVSVAASMDNGSIASASYRSTCLAESVYDGVRNKIRRLQQDIRRRDANIAALQQELGALQEHHHGELDQAAARAHEALLQQRAEQDAAAARNLAFVDRLLADKDDLGRRLGEATAQLRAVGERHDRAIAALKEGWAGEMKRQKEAWTAAERVQREQWAEGKTREIKEMTIKGLEGELQKLMAKHRTDMEAAQQRAAEEMRKQLDAQQAQHGAATRQLRDRLARDQDDAIEKERQAAQNRMREAAERYEQQMQTQRLRLASDHDMRLEQLEQGHREARRAHEDAIEKLKQQLQQREEQLQQELSDQKATSQRHLERELAALKEEQLVQQEGWKAAVSERSRRELADKESALRQQLTRQRDAELEVIVRRLEQEAEATMAAIKLDFEKQQASLDTQHAAALQAARKAEARMADRFRNAGAAASAAEERAAAAESQLQQLRREMDAKNGTIRWLESQVTTAKEEAHRREQDLRAVVAKQEDLQGDALKLCQAEVAALQQRLATAAEDAAALRSKQAAEMAHVEARVKAAITKKDEMLTALREQLATATQQLRTTEAVLAAQQDEFCD